MTNCKCYRPTFNDTAGTEVVKIQVKIVKPAVHGASTVPLYMSY